MSTSRIRYLTPALLTLALTGLAGTGAASAAPSVPPSHDIRTAVSAAASQAGLGDKLSSWSEKDGVIRVALTQVKGNEAAVLKAKLGKSVIVTQEQRYETATNRTPVRSKSVEHRMTFAQRVKTWAKSPTTTAPAPVTPGAYPPFIDSPAYKGGDRIVSQQTINGTNYVVQCTVTAPFITGGATDMLTAGHCGPVGTHWYQGYWDGSKIQSSGDMGNAAAVSWSNNQIDGTLLSGGSYTPAITTSATTTAPVIGAATVAVGSHVCTDGSFTGYTCGATVTATDVCANVSENGSIVTVCGLDIADAPTKVVQSGDSGGPVVIQSGTGVQIAGTISAQANNGTRVLFTDVRHLQTVFSGTVAK
ncbi:MAG TPA: hypothetical protein VF867_19640 [Arthrobacter sp.]